MNTRGKLGRGKRVLFIHIIQGYIEGVEIAMEASLQNGGALLLHVSNHPKVTHSRAFLAYIPRVSPTPFTLGDQPALTCFLY